MPDPRDEDEQRRQPLVAAILAQPDQEDDEDTDEVSKTCQQLMQLRNRLH